jgi:5-methylcytosine-specific restriction endonuclease McrA
MANRNLAVTDMTVDHIIPQSKGGKNTWSNTICACHWCNNRKGNRTDNEAGMKLLWEPKRPRTNYFVVGSKIPKEWKYYIEV